MKKTITFVGITLAAIFASCNAGVPLAKGESDNNRTYKIEYLFEHDGCKVYRFYDYGNYVYFTNCEGNTTAISNDSIRHRTYNTIRVR